MNKTLLHKEVQEYIASHYKEETSKLAFKGSPFPDVFTRELLEQLTGKKKAEKKLPTWFSHSNIIYPPNINLEQTSSEITAKYKASLITGRSLADLTGGFGIDSYYFSKQVEKVYHLEMDQDLQEIASHNFGILGVRNIYSKAENGIEFLQNTSKNFDWVYLDPSRRDHAGGRVFFLSDCLPNVPNELKLLQKKAENLMIKTSPLLDLQAGLKELDNVEEIHVVAVENDVKELLWILKNKTIEKVKITTINFQKKGNQIYNSSWLPGQESNLSSPLTYLYEPNAAIMKSGAFGNIAKDFTLFKLHPNTQLFTSKELKDFPGRRFKIIETIPFKTNVKKVGLKTRKVNVTVRNFPESVTTLKKRFNLRDGGDQYLFFTTSLNGEKLILRCVKV